MANYIPGSGSVSYGDAAGSSRSIARVKDVKEDTSVTGQASLSTLRDWFRAYVGAPGNFDESHASHGATVAFSHFHYTTIFGVAVRAQQEDPTYYRNNNNGHLQLYGLDGSGSYYFSGNGQDGYPSGGGVVHFQNFDSDTNYNIYCKDRTTDADFSIIYNPGYHTGSHSIIGTTSMGVNGQHYYWSSGTSSSWSEWSYFWLDTETPKKRYG